MSGHGSRPTPCETCEKLGAINADLLAACRAVRAAMDEMSDRARDEGLDAADVLIGKAIERAEGRP